MIQITTLAVIAKVALLLVLTGKTNLTYFIAAVRKLIKKNSIDKAILDQHHPVQVMLVTTLQGQNDQMPVVNPI